jgi:tetratricopeptide (TPR) repeat protein
MSMHTAELAQGPGRGSETAPGDRRSPWLLRTLREAPVTVPALAAVALFVAWATDQGGYPVTRWAPGGLVMLLLVAIAVGTIGWRPSEMPRATKIALTCLAAYTALSFLSILWADVPGDALEGADRTLLYLLVFTLFASWRLRGPSAALLIGVWVFSLVGLGVYVLVHLDGLSSVGLRAALSEGRLVYPDGYVNAEAAQWMMAAWPAALLARSPSFRPLLRGAFAGAAVLLTDVALLSVSRGALIASVAVIVLVFALIPGRLRTFAVMVPIALGVGLSAPAVLKVGEGLEGTSRLLATRAASTSAVHGATLAILLAAVAVALAVAAAAAFERRRNFSRGARRRARGWITAVAVFALVAVVGGGLAAAGDPVSRLHHAWETFKSPQGYAANSKDTNRLFSGLGSNRYDFYRVALDEFAAHPLAGIGADNYAVQYLAHGRSGETPRYPHSVELRTLTDTGLVGAILAVIGLGAALWAGNGALRRRSGATWSMSGAAAAAALVGFGYWAVHGSADWFWEYAGLGAPAFAMLGIACALDPARGPRRARRSDPSKSSARRPVAWVTGAVAVALGLGAAVLLAGPWLAALEVHNAAQVWARSPSIAYARLNEAAKLNPLSAEPYVVAGSVALRYGELSRADHEFARALRRAPDEEYATLERGAIASQRGHSALALALISRALKLYPHNGLAREALEGIRAGERVNVGELNAAILRNAQQLE